MAALRLEFFAMVCISFGTLAPGFQLTGEFDKVDSCDTETHVQKTNNLHCNVDSGCRGALPANPTVVSVSEPTETGCIVDVASDGTLTVTGLEPTNEPDCYVIIKVCIEKPTTMAPAEETTTAAAEATTTPDC